MKSLNIQTEVTRVLPCSYDHSLGCCLKLTIVVSVLIALLCASTPVVAQRTAPRLHVRVGPNVAVWPRGAPQSEPFIVAHPSKPGILIIGTADWVANRGLVPHAYATTDRGRTWIRASLPGLLDDLSPTIKSKVAAIHGSRLIQMAARISQSTSTFQAKVPR